MKRRFEFDSLKKCENFFESFESSESGERKANGKKRKKIERKTEKNCQPIYVQKVLQRSDSLARLVAMV